MGKQSIGVPLLNYNLRADTSIHIMDYPQIPLVNTYMSDNLGLSQLPSGMNVVLAISTFTGYNQEDSIIFNKASIEKGLFRVVTRRTILIEEKKALKIEMKSSHIHNLT